jgi:hypothetical protein
MLYGLMMPLNSQTFFLSSYLKSMAATDPKSSSQPQRGSQWQQRPWGIDLPTERALICFAFYPNLICSAEKRNGVSNSNRKKKEQSKWNNQLLCIGQHLIASKAAMKETMAHTTWLKIDKYSPITYYWTVSLILDHSYLVGNSTNPKIVETKALEPLKSWHFCFSNFRTC